MALNVGSNDGVKEGDIFSVYELGEKDLIDPFTKENLWILEIPRGSGHVRFV